MNFIKFALSALLVITLMGCSGGGQSPSGQTADQNQAVGRDQTADQDQAAGRDQTVVDSHADDGFFSFGKFNSEINKPIIQSACIGCHASEGVAGGTKLVFIEGVSELEAGYNALTLLDFGQPELLLQKVSGSVSHYGSLEFTYEPTSIEYQRLNDFLNGEATDSNQASDMDNTDYDSGMPTGNDNTNMDDMGNGSSNNSNGSHVEDSTNSNNSGNDHTNVSGKQLWDSGCASCHGTDGNGKSPILGSLYRPDLVEYITQNMPYGAPAKCDASCSEKLAGYMTSSFEFPGAEEIIEIPEVHVDSNVSSASKAEALKVLHSASLNLLKRLPTDEEIIQVEENGSAALSPIFDAQLEEPALLEQLDVIFNSSLGINVTRNKDGYHSFMRNYSWNSFENGDSEWPKEYKRESGLQYTTLRRYTSNGHALAPVELIKYVVKNNRPFTEILTADYTMLNWYAAKSFGLEDRYPFRDLPNGKDLGVGVFTKDPEHFVPVYLPNIPSAGILTTGAYMQAHITTDTNRNRNRAYKLFKHFLDTDLFEIGGERPGDGDSIHANPELNDPRCTSCHNVMDPVASAYKNWISFAGMGRPFYDANPSSKEWNTNGILPAGFNGEFVPEGKDSMPWLAKKVTKDPRFARAIVKIVFEDFTGQALIPSSLDGKTYNSVAYREQQAYIEAVAKQFIEDNYNMKKMIKNLLLNDYIVKTNNNPLAKLMLKTASAKTKILETLGDKWSWFDSFGTMYGSSQAPSGAKASIQLRMAEDMSCALTAKQFSKYPEDRILFKSIEPNVVAGTSDNDAQIKQAIIETYYRLTGYHYEASDRTIELAFEVYESALALGQAGIADGSISTRITGDCRVNKNQASVNKNFVDYDDQYYTRAWQAVLQYALMDPRYFYY